LNDAFKGEDNVSCSVGDQADNDDHHDCLRGRSPSSSIEDQERMGDQVHPHHNHLQLHTHQEGSSNKKTSTGWMKNPHLHLTINTTHSNQTNPYASMYSYSNSYQVPNLRPDYLYLKYILSDSGSHARNQPAVTCLTFDNREELLWMGNDVLQKSQSKQLCLP